MTSILCDFLLTSPKIGFEILGEAGWGLVFLP
jgi:hypothetical protein